MKTEVTVERECLWLSRDVEMSVTSLVTPTCDAVASLHPVMVWVDMLG